MYVVLQEVGGWETWAIGECDKEGKLLAILETNTLEPLGDGFRRGWRVVGQQHTGVRQALEQLKMQRRSSTELVAVKG